MHAARFVGELSPASQLVVRTLGHEAFPLLRGVWLQQLVLPERCEHAQNLSASADCPAICLILAAHCLKLQIQMLCFLFVPCLASVSVMCWAAVGNVAVVVGVRSGCPRVWLVLVLPTRHSNVFP